jgi:hypothetical protein
VGNLNKKIVVVRQQRRLSKGDDGDDFLARKIDTVLPATDERHQL